MTGWLNSWKDFERICAISGVTPDEMEQRGKRFLIYYKTLCCTPDYALPPEPAEEAIKKKEHFLSYIESLFDNGCEELTAGRLLDNLSVWKIYPSEQRKRLLSARTEAALQPKEVMYA